MSNSKPIIPKISDVNLTNLSFSKPKVDETGRKTIFVNTPNKTGIIFQTPKMSVPNGIKRWPVKGNTIDDPIHPGDKFELEVAFSNLEDPEIAAFHGKMLEYDELIKKAIQDNSQEWIAKPKVSIETIEDAIYRPTVRVAMDKMGNKLPYPDKMRAKLTRLKDTRLFVSSNSQRKQFKIDGTTYKGEPLLAYNGKDGKELSFNVDNCEDTVQKGSRVFSVIALSYICILDGKVSTIWKLIQFVVFQNNQSINSCVINFTPDSEGEGTEATELPQDEDVPEFVDVVDSVPETPAYVNDEAADDELLIIDDEDDEAQVLVEETAALTVEPKKKRQSKKA